MSYCRNNGKDSDVYLIPTGDEERSFWECVGCYLAPRQILGGVEVAWTKLDTRQEALDHLLKHRAEGHKVPEHALERLRREIAEEAL